jgi:hypothetical protein
MCNGMEGKGRYGRMLEVIGTFYGKGRQKEEGMKTSGI